MEQQRATVQIQLLGDFRMTIGTQTIAATAWRRKAAAIVKLLALHHGRLHRDQIIDLLWPELDGAAALNNLHRTLHPARRVLEPGLAAGVRPRFLRFVGEILVLVPDDRIEIDIELFREAAEAARIEPTPARYERAIARYTGELLPDDRFADWTMLQRDALEELWKATLLGFGELLARLGRGEDAVALLERLIASYPTDEPAARLLMRLAIDAGQRTRAHRIYEQLRVALASDLGAEPDVETRSLLRSIDDAERPEAAVSMPTTNAPTNLPSSQSSFVGREHDVIDVARLVAANRLVTLTGPGGAGKTRLAIETGRTLLARFPDGVWLVELGSVTDPDLVVSVVAAALSIAESTTRPLRDIVLATLVDRRMLLILDNCEHLRDASAALARAILANAPSVHLLATSRIPLGLGYEQLRPVDALALPDPGAPAGQIAKAESIRLFLDRGRERWPDISLTATSAPIAARIVRQLDGLPLAIELAAARAGLLGFEQIERLLADRFRLLRRHGRDGPLRQQTLEAAVDWSYRLLSPSEQALLRQIAVFPASFDLNAVVSVSNRDSLDAIDRIESLVQHSLIQVVSRGSQARFQLLETIRAFGQARLTEDPEQAPIRKRFIGWVCRFAAAEEVNLDSADQVACLDRISREVPNIRAALNWLAEQGDGERYLGLCGALWRFWRNRGAIAEGRRWLTDGLEQPWPVADSIRAKALLGAGLLAKDMADNVVARRDLAESIALARRSGEHLLEAGAINNLAMVDLDSRDLEAAERGFAESYQIYRAYGDELGAALRLGNLALVATEKGEIGRARAYYAESIEILRRHGHSLGVANAINNLGFLAMVEGEYRTGADYYLEALGLYRALDNPGQVAFAQVNHGWALLACGEIEPARSLIRDGLQTAVNLGNRRVIGLSFVLLGVSLLSVAPERAARLIAAGDRDLREQITVLPEYYETMVQASRARIAEAIDREAAARSEAIGRSLTAEQLLDLATYPAEQELSDK